MSDNRSNLPSMARMRKSPALGWVAFGLLVIIVVAGALLFGGNPANKTSVTADVPGTGATR